MQTHSESRFLPYPPQAMYALVADVERYPEFLPWTAAARIRSRTEHEDRTELLADLVISFKLFRERFGSRVVLWPAALAIDTEYVDGPFRHMVSRWEFHPAEGGTEVRFRVEFEFRNRLLQGAAGLFYGEAMASVVRAFERRAAALHASGDA